MSEVDEVALSLKDGYLQYQAARGRNPSMESIREYVHMRLRGYESYHVMGNVADSLIELVMPNRNV